MHSVRDPVPIYVMKYDKFKGESTICQVLRDIYSETEKEKIKLKCRIAMSMAKAMTEKLKCYKKNT